MHPRHARLTIKNQRDILAASLAIPRIIARNTLDHPGPARLALAHARRGSGRE